MREIFNRGKSIRRFFVFFILETAALFLLFYDRKINTIDSTMFAFSYKLGFISRGFIGSVFTAVNKILPGDQYNYQGVMIFTQAFTALLFLFLFFFAYQCLKRVAKNQFSNTCYMLYFFQMFAVPMFVNSDNFGRLDLYLVLISLLSVFLLMNEKAEWLLVPLSAIAIMIHQGYAFMFYNILLVLLLYKILTKEKKEQKKYIAILISSLTVCVLLFFYFEFFAHATGLGVGETVIQKAKMLGDHGGYHKQVIEKEIMGLSIANSEKEFRIYNAFEFPIFLVLILPYLMIGIRFFKGLVARAVDKKEKIVYLFVALGGFTIVPVLLLKCDFGRWMFAVVTYYSVVVLTLLAMGDKAVNQEIEVTFCRLKEHGVVAVFLFAYAFLFTPFRDTSICNLTYQIAHFFIDYCLHLISGAPGILS